LLMWQPTLSCVTKRSCPHQASANIMVFRTEKQAMLFWRVMRTEGLRTGYGIFYMTKDGKGGDPCVRMVSEPLAMPNS
jgi:hypothetical protein